MSNSVFTAWIRSGVDVSPGKRLYSIIQYPQSRKFLSQTGVSNTRRLYGHYLLDTSRIERATFSYPDYAAFDKIFYVEPVLSSKRQIKRFRPSPSLVGCYHSISPHVAYPALIGAIQGHGVIYRP